MTHAATSFMVFNSAHASECIVKAEGEIDVATAPALREVLMAAVDTASERVIVDLTDVSFIDSSGLSGLLEAFKRGRMSGIDLALRAPSRRVRMVLGVSGLDKVLPVIGAEAANGHDVLGFTVPWPLLDVDSDGTTADS